VIADPFDDRMRAAIADAEAFAGNAAAPGSEQRDTAQALYANSVMDRTRPKAGNDTLLVIIDAMKRIPTLRISVEGHTDRYGSEAYNNTLAKKRAETVTKQLLKLAGKDAASLKDRIVTSSFGEQCLVTTAGADESEPPPANCGSLVSKRAKATTARASAVRWTCLRRPMAAYCCWPWPSASPRIRTYLLDLPWEGW
jgi:outer membrane protein OmpA-like peptidoglycan-associated protein